MPLVRGSNNPLPARTGWRLWQSEPAEPQVGLAAFVAACPSALTVVRMPDMSIVDESPAAFHLVGCRGPRHGVPLERQWPTAADFRAFKVRLERTGAVEHLEQRLQRNDGEQFWCSVSAHYTTLGGEPLLFMSLADMTAQIAARAEIARQRDALHDSEKLSALGQLLGGISHELNNPLSVLVGQALMLKEKATDEATRLRAERISKAADRASRIVRSFLALAREQRSNKSATELNDLILDVLDAIGDRLRSHSIDVVLELPSGLPRVLVDPDQIRQVFSNLFMNAQQAMDGGKG
ncbi:MAG: histidine kinase dimerization/phospho-acceptor domain-containing protein, partial [Pseudomonadota bacterium]